MKKYIFTLAAALMTFGAMAEVAPNTMVLTKGSGTKPTLLIHNPSYQIVGANHDSIQAYKNGVTYGQPVALANFMTLNYKYEKNIRYWYISATEDTLHANQRYIDGDLIQHAYITISQDDFTYTKVDTAKAVLTPSDNYPFALEEHIIEYYDEDTMQVNHAVYPGKYVSQFYLYDMPNVRAVDSFTIAKAPATVTALDAEKVYGDFDPEGFSMDTVGVIEGDWVSLDIEREAGEAVGTYAINAKIGEVYDAPARASERVINATYFYDWTFNPGTFTINKKAATVTAQDNNKTYGDTDPVLAIDTTGLVAGDQLTGITITRAAGENVGTYAIDATAAEAANPNYSLTFVPATFTINKKAATVNTVNVEKTYGDTDPELTYTATGLVGGDVLTGIAVTRATGENAGTYAINATAAEAANPNYTLTFVPATFTINRKDATVLAVDANKVYGSNDPALNYTVQGLVNGDQLLDIVVERETGENVGTYTITARENAWIGAPARTDGFYINNNYDLTFVPATFTINKKAATVNAVDAEKTYGDVDPELTYTATGLVGDDQLTDITITRAEGETVGTYAINATAAESANPNYTLTFNGATFTITSMGLDPEMGNEGNEFFSVSAAGYCQGDEAGIQYAIEAGNPVAYSITFGAEAKAQGFVDVPTTPMPAGDIKSLDVVIPMNCRYGRYSADVYFYNALGIDPIKQSVTFTVNIPVVDIHQLFYDVVAIDNNEGLYTSYQWYHNGELIPGATGQYYQQEGGLSGTYYVEVTVEGLDYEAHSCVEEYEGQKKAPAAQKVLRSNEVIIITPNNREYNANGMLMK